MILGKLVRKVKAMATVTCKNGHKITLRPVVAGKLNMIVCWECLTVKK